MHSGFTAHKANIYQPRPPAMKAKLLKKLTKQEMSKDTDIRENIDQLFGSDMDVDIDLDFIGKCFSFCVSCCFYTRYLSFLLKIVLYYV